jgi:hypothetical protein
MESPSPPPLRPDNRADLLALGIVALSFSSSCAGGFTGMFTGAWIGATFGSLKAWDDIGGAMYGTLAGAALGLAMPGTALLAYKAWGGRKP